GFARPARHATQRAARRARANEGVRVGREPRHTGLVPENAAARTRTGWIDGENGNPLAPPDQVQPEGFDEGALADARHPADADAHGATGVRQQLFEQALRR